MIDNEVAADVSVTADATGNESGPQVPDRAEQPVSETVERFLRAIVAQVPIERIDELHLFSPLRQGQVETGIAVVAVRGEKVVVADEVSRADAGDEVVEATDDVTADVTDDVTADVSDDVTDDVTDDVGETEAIAQADGTEEVEDVPESDEVIAQADGSGEEDGELEAAEPAGAHTRQEIERHTVYTARYRYVIKGPERGKWETNVVEEADAPLVTVETVVRGVQRRAGEDSEIVRFNARQIAKALRQPLPESGNSTTDAHAENAS